MRTKFNRRERRAKVKSSSRNQFAGVPTQVIIMGNSHKVIRHNPKLCLGIYTPPKTNA